VFYAPTTSVKLRTALSPYFHFYFSSCPDLALVPEVSFFAHPEDTRGCELFELLNFYPLLIAHPRQEQEHTDSELSQIIVAATHGSPRFFLSPRARSERAKVLERDIREKGVLDHGGASEPGGVVLGARAARVPILTESHALRNQRKQIVPLAVHRMLRCHTYDTIRRAQIGFEPAGVVGVVTALALAQAQAPACCCCCYWGSTPAG
jgi:hypothetical protein